MHIDIKVGLSCNNACHHCIMSPVQRRTQKNGQQIDDDTNSVKAKIEHAAKLGYDRITLTGGEVTIRGDFLQLVEHAILRGLSVTIQTNGRVLSNHKLVNGLAAFDRSKIDLVLAIHSSDQKIHDQITRRIGSYTQTTKAAQLLIEKEIPLCCKVVLSNLNYSQIDSTLQFIGSLGIKEVIIAFPHAEDFSQEQFQQVVPSYSEIKKYMSNALNNARLCGVNVACETFPFCIMANEEDWSSNFDLIHFSQEIESRSTLILMPGSSNSIDWRASRKEIKCKSPQCQYCLLDYICEGPWYEYVENYGSNEFEPIKSQKSIEKFLKYL